MAHLAFRNLGGGTLPSLASGPAVNGRDQAAAFLRESWVHAYYISNATTNT